ncbi:hypothetical protein CICLE_v10010465mg [Citrus x clementina]|uniref:Elongation factor P C-terminal domain-containing protein n=1 Tax=Citrus clementina TaxID=85681 RepID=V4UKD6_CITCL|nr:hypothetical protein CICLE_v10010465mg [Citrus x clementina]
MVGFSWLRVTKGLAALHGQGVHCLGLAQPRVLIFMGGSKPATLDTGAVVNVPLFVNIGDEILVYTRIGLYMTRA